MLDRAALAGPPKLKKGQYLYTHTLVVTVNRQPTADGVIVTTTKQSNELWVGANGSGLAIEHRPERTIKEPIPAQTLPGAPSAPATTAPDSAPKKKIALPQTKVSRYKRGTLGSSELGAVNVGFRDRLLASYGLDADRLSRLSYDQQAFNRALLASAARVTKELGGSVTDAPAVNRQAFALVAGLLGQWGEPMPKTLRNALYQFASTLDGVAVDQNATSAATGKQVIKLSLGDAAILFEPGSYRLAGSTYGSGDTETTIQAVRSKIVNTLPNPPATP